MYLSSVFKHNLVLCLLLILQVDYIILLLMHGRYVKHLIIVLRLLKLKVRHSGVSMTGSQVSARTRRPDSQTMGSGIPVDVAMVQWLSVVVGRPLASTKLQQQPPPMTIAP